MKYVILNSVANKATTGKEGIIKPLDATLENGTFYDIIEYVVNDGNFKADEAEVAMEISSYLQQQDGENILLEVKNYDKPVALTDKVSGCFNSRLMPDGVEADTLDLEVNLRSRVG